MRLSVPPGLKTWAATHPRLVALILYTALAIIYFGPGLLPGHTTSASDYLWSVAPWNTKAPSGLFVWSTHPFEVGSNTQLVDPTTVFEPYLQYTRSQLPHIPLWDPYIMGGTPFLGDMQSAIFSPFSIPAYILPFWWSLSVIAVMKVVVAAMGAFLLGRALKMRFAGAFLCGTVFGFGLFLIAWLPWPLASVFPWIPWMLLATEYLIRRPGPLTASGLAFIVALQFFGGHPESSFQALFAVGCYFILRLLQSPGGAVAAMRAAAAERRSRLGALYRSVRGPLLGLVVAMALGAALAAVAIVPFLELLKNSSDLSSRPRGLVYVQPKFFFASLVPDYFDRVPTNFLIEDAFYAGVLPIMLALIALMKAKVERIAVALFGVFCIVVVLGIQPLFGFVGRLPGFDETYLSRLTILYLLCVALLAGWGLDDLITRRPTARRAVVAATMAGGVFLLPVVIVLATARNLVAVLRPGRSHRMGICPGTPVQLAQLGTRHPTRFDTDLGDHCRIRAGSPVPAHRPGYRSGGFLSARHPLGRRRSVPGRLRREPGYLRFPCRSAHHPGHQLPTEPVSGALCGRHPVYRFQSIAP